MGWGEGRGTRVRDLVTDSQSSTKKDLRGSGMGRRMEGRAWKESSYMCKWGVSEVDDWFFWDGFNCVLVFGKEREVNFLLVGCLKEI